MGTVFKNFRKILTVVLSMFAVASLLSACEYEEVYGQLVEKRIDAYTTMQCTSYNKSGLCTVSIPIYHKDHVFVVRDLSTEKMDEWDVTVDTYNTCLKNDYLHRETDGSITCSQNKFF